MSNFYSWLNREDDEEVARSKAVEEQQKNLNDLQENVFRGNVVNETTLLKTIKQGELQKKIACKHSRQLIKLHAEAKHGISLNELILGKVHAVRKRQLILPIILMLPLLLIASYLYPKLETLSRTASSVASVASARGSLVTLANNSESFRQLAISSRSFKELAINSPHFKQLALTTPVFKELASSTTQINRIAQSAPHIDRLAQSAPYLDRLSQSTPYLERLTVSATLQNNSVFGYTPNVNDVLNSTLIETLAFSKAAAGLIIESSYEFRRLLDRVHLVDKWAPVVNNINVRADNVPVLESLSSLDKKIEAISELIESETIESETIESETIESETIESETIESETAEKPSTNTVEFQYDNADVVECTKNTPCELLKIKNFVMCSAEMNIDETIFSATVTHIVNQLNTTNKKLILEFVGGAHSFASRCESRAQKYVVAFDRASWLKNEFLKRLVSRTQKDQISITNRIDILLSTAQNFDCSDMGQTCMEENRMATINWYFSST